MLTELYAGTIKIEFLPDGHKFVILENGKPIRVPSVTNITGIIDKSQALIPWAVNNTIEVVRQSINPSTPYTNEQLANIYNNAKKRYRYLKRAAAEIGTLAHQWLERYFTGQKPPIPKDNEPHRLAVDASLDWLNKHKVRILNAERIVFSKKYRVSGILDLLAEVDGIISLVDWKSGNGIYPDMRLQTAAYNKFYEEETGEKIAQRIIVRLGKYDGFFYSQILPRKTLKADFAGFLGAYSLFTELARIKKESRSVETETSNWVDEL